MACAAFALSVFMAAASSGQAPAGWEKIFESTGPKEWMFSVLAFGPNEWFAGGVWGVARGTKAGIDRKTTGPRAVMGLVGDRPDNVFALGDGELVMHFDGKTWAEQHVGPRAKRPRQVDDLLHTLLDVEGKVVAFGPSLVLIRQGNTWTQPTVPERRELLRLTGSGPPVPLPPKCAKAGWFWLGKDAGFFDCHDGRTFLYREGTITPKGKMPRECATGFNELTTGQGELFASCGPGKLWKTEGDVWHLYATFKGATVGSISVTDTCVFVAGTRAIWRNCRP